MRSDDPVIALTCSDIHLQLRTPPCRADEKSWTDCMKKSLWEISELAEKHRAAILCAGDIFDRWNSSAELINFAMQNLPPMYAIPGNHDLPMHQPELVHRSAYWTLYEAGKITDISGKVMRFNWHGMGVVLYGFPFDKTLQRKPGKGLHIALTHEYLWVPGCEYNGATQDTRLGARAKKLSEFDVVVVGDNHVAFDRKLKSGTRVINCGTVFRRKSNEASYTPRVGLIHASGSVSEHRLDCAQDKILKTIPPEAEQADDEEIADFIEELSGLHSSGMNFKDAMHQAMAMRKSPKLVKQMILEAMENA